MMFRTAKGLMALGLMMVIAACGSAGSTMKTTDPKTPDDDSNEPGSSGSNDDDETPAAGGSSGGMTSRPGSTAGTGSNVDPDMTAGGSGSTNQPSKPAEPSPAADPTSPEMGACWIKNAAFCDTFDVPKPGGRGGDIDESLWAVGRINEYNGTQGIFNTWQETVMEACGDSTSNVLPPNDFKICSGGGIESSHLNNSIDDHGGFVVQSYRIRRPFDFKDRTGVVSFDIDGRSQMPTGHGYWFNMFISEEPVPAPYQDGGGIALWVKNGFGIEFQGAAAICHDDHAKENTVTNMFIEKDYEIVHEQISNSETPCFKTDPMALNHLEVHVSQTKVEVYATDAGGKELKKIVTYDNLNLPFTRGYVSVSHAHYSANKYNPACPDPKTNCPILHSWNTYRWDNIGFDGPKLPVPRAYEVIDNDDDIEPRYGINIGYNLLKDGPYGPRKSFTLENVDLSNLKEALLLFNAWNFQGGSIDYKFNGGTKHSIAHFFPTQTAAARAIMVKVDPAELKEGTNTLEVMSSGGDVGFANADLEIHVKE